MCLFFLTFTEVLVLLPLDQFEMSVLFFHGSGIMMPVGSEGIGICLTIIFVLNIVLCRLIRITFALSRLATIFKTNTFLKQCRYFSLYIFLFLDIPKKILDYKKQRRNAQIFPILSINMENLWDKLSTLYHLWPWYQWVFSLATLIWLYWITGNYYNKWLSDKGGWLEWSTRIWLIIFDLSLNLSLGLYYLDYRETLFGHFMLKCPIAISPVIFVVELICFYIYRRWGSAIWKKRIPKK